MTIVAVWYPNEPVIQRTYVTCDQCGLIFPREDPKCSRCKKKVA